MADPKASSVQTNGSQDQMAAMAEKITFLEKKYQELLERTISLMEPIVKKSLESGDGKKSVDAGNEVEGAVENGAKEKDTDEEKSKKAKGDVAGAETDQKASGKAVVAEPRVKSVERRLNKETMEFADIDGKIAQASATAKDGTKLDIAFTFRKVYAQRQINLPHYPEEQWETDVVNMRAPFAPIVFHWDTLVEKAAISEEEENEISVEARQDRVDLRRLLDHVKSSPELEPYFKTRVSHMKSKVTSYDNPLGAVSLRDPIQSTPVYFLSKKEVQEGDEKGQFWYFVATAMDWNGKAKEFKKVPFRLQIKAFEGLKSINSLEFFPTEYYDDWKDLEEELAKRVTDVYQKHEDSVSLSLSSDYGGAMTKRTPGVKGQIIVDFEAYSKYGPEDGSANMGELMPAFLGSSFLSCSCSICTKRKAWTPNRTFNRSNSSDSTSGIATDFVLYPPRVLGYITADKIWAQFRVDKIKEVNKDSLNDEFDQKLALDQAKKDMIKKLILNHRVRGEKNELLETQINDIVPGKGKGLVMLLHVRSLRRARERVITNSSIAIATAKPLLSVSVADIGLEPEKVERNLRELFTLATSWDAVFLIDEADVFMEQRSSEQNATRNALVSVLLRVLEYYDGILVLTTNRIKSFDVAVQSRIHLAVLYDELDEGQVKKIWHGFLEQLNEKNTTDKYKIEEWVDKWAYKSKLNGRQIRNIISSAQALARGRNGLNKKLTCEDIETVFEFTERFSRDLEGLYNDYRKEAVIEGRKRR
ncbi:hypothetical protein IFR04_004477 [Cadophora malorum]|uniref:ATPase AAA-type core domain-containing protein n=1 Tax=Cadophora malorum TaxID=108018 RepID=A0A8H7WCL1_9HELO|nr:hypothetical protein IFR04_004477 [Cadophora malorum]